MPRFQQPVLGALLVVGAIAVPARAEEVTLGRIANLTGRTFRLRAEGQGVRFLGADGTVIEDPRGVDIPSRANLSVLATRSWVAAGHGFSLTCRVSPAETLEVRLGTWHNPAIRMPALKLVAWDHQAQGAGAARLAELSYRMVGSVLYLQEKGTPGWKPAAAGGTETKADGAGDRKSQVASRTPGGDAGKPKAAGAGAGETKAAGADGAGETKAAGAGAGFKITYAADAEAGKRLEEQCERVRKAVAEWREADPGKPIQLILGAQAWQWPRFGSSHWVYLDVFGRTGQGAPDFCADFNDLGQLGKAAAALAGQVDHIYLDPQVLKFSTWKKAHLDLFRAMLRPGGTFHLPLEQCGMGFLTLPPYQPEDASDPGELLAYAVIDQPADVLPRDYEVPRNLTDFPKDFQARAHALCMERLLKPAILGMLLDTFDVVEEETAEPEFLRRHPHRTPHAETFYACRTEAKS